MHDLKVNICALVITNTVQDKDAKLTTPKKRKRLMQKWDFLVTAVPECL